MSNPQNPYGSGDGSGGNNPNGQNPNGQDPNGQNPNNQPSSAPGYGNDQNAGQQPPQYGSQPNYGQGGNDGSQGYGQQPPQYGSQPNYGQPNDQNQYGQQPNFGQPNDQYGQNQYGDSQYGQDQYGQSQYGQNQYDANQYGQQPAYPGAEGSSDQFIPANPNAAYGQYPSGGGTSKNIWGILALIGGIVGVLGAFVFGGGALFGIAAIVFGFLGLSAIKKGLANNKGFNITGIVLGGLSVVISIAVIVATVLFGGLFINAVNDAAEEQKQEQKQEENPFAEPSTNPPSTPASDGSSGSDSEDAAPAQAGEVEIGTDVTAAINVRSGTAGEYASGAESTNGEIAIVTMTVKNDSSSDVKMTLTNLTATDGGSKEYDDVFDSGNYKGSLAFTDPVPAGGETTYELAFGVPKAEIDGMHLKLKLVDDLGKGKDFEFYKQ